MSTRAELMTLFRLAPEADSTTLSDANLRIILARGAVDLSLKGRALPKNEKVNLVANSREHVVSGASPVLSGDDFLSIDLLGGGVLFYDGSRWVGPPEFMPKTREWLDLNDPDWRTRSATTATPSYWFLDTAENNSANLVVGLSETPSANQTDYLWIHFLARGVLPTDDTHYFWTGSTTQLVHLEPYEMLLVYYALEFFNRVISHNDSDADKYRILYEQGAQAMARRMPLAEHLGREGFDVPPYFSRGASGMGRR